MFLFEFTDFLGNFRLIMRRLFDEYDMSQTVYFEVKVVSAKEKAAAVHTGSDVNYTPQVIYVIRFVANANY